MIASLLAALLALASATPVETISASAGDRLTAFLRDTLHTSNYRVAHADLDDDGIEEAIVYVTDSRYCGSGGCELLILKPSAFGFRRVMKATITRLPIRQLSTRSYGWSDIGVLVAGGGVP